MSDHVFNRLEGTVEYLTRDLEILEEPVDRRLQAAEARPNANDVLWTSQLRPTFRSPPRVRMA